MNKTQEHFRQFGLDSRFVEGNSLAPGTTELALAEMFPTPSPYLTDPARWAVERAGVALWSKQREIMESIAVNRYTAVRSCHGTGKSFSAALTLGWWIDSSPAGDAFALWTAPRGPQVHAIIGRELRALHKRIGMPGRITLDGNWYLEDDVLVGMGRKPADHDEHGFQGIHAKRVLIELDEACGIAKALWQGAESLMTNMDCRFVAYGNPDDPSTEFNEVCKPGSGWNVIDIDALQSPNFTAVALREFPELLSILADEGLEPFPDDEHVPDYVREQLVSPGWVMERIKRWGVGSALWDSKVRGRFPKVSADNLFPPHLITFAQGNDLPGIDTGQFGLDVARFGSDRSVLYRNRGGQIRLDSSWSHKDTMETSGIAANKLREFPHVPMNIDVIGIGSGVYDRLAEQGWMVYPFCSSNKANDPTRFVNRRAEAYWGFREAMAEGLIDLDPDDDELVAELGVIKYKFDSSGRIGIERKEDIKKRIGKSPDHADAAVQAHAQPSASIDEDWFGPNSDRVQGITDDLLKRAM